MTTRHDRVRQFTVRGIQFEVVAYPDDWNVHGLDKAFEYIMASLQRGPGEYPQTMIPWDHERGEFK